MINTILDELDIEASKESVDALIDRVCGYIPPLWDLSNYVAVNPFLGFADRRFVDAARTVSNGLNANVLPLISYFRQRWEAGAFDAEDLVRAANRANLEAGVLHEILAGKRVMPMRKENAVRTFAEQVDDATGTDWNEALIRSMTRWCAVYASEPTSSWSLPPHGLFASWREAETVDRSLEIAGLKGWRQWMRQLPTTADAAIERMLTRLELPAADREAYLYRLMGGAFGWACFFKRSCWQSGPGANGLVAELLAIRVCGDAALAELAPSSHLANANAFTVSFEDENIRYALQEALEDSYAAGVLGRFAPPAAEPGALPLVQAVFCIDVRSEVLRRHLEAQSDAIETKGFAGFFGVSLDWQSDGQSSARCPVLLQPSVRLAGVGAGARGWSTFTLKYLQGAPASAFSFVEVLGASYGVELTTEALALRNHAQSHEGTDALSLGPSAAGAGIDLPTRVDLACGILTNMGLRARFARLILLCGHEGHSTNNPHAAGLDCGACGGHGGSINARVAAALLNDAEVRTHLLSRNIDIPSDTLFVAGVHDTSIDQVTVHDSSLLPQSHAADLQRLRDWLLAAGTGTRAERAKDLGLNNLSSTGISARIAKRARDWSEVRPEWGLARNAAFIAARRARTRGVNLAGRTFLHDYDCAADTDNSVLTLILTAPMVVASWINLQYFGSTVDNDVFGCGDKALHNRVGTLGVVLGNGGDLRTGLPKQSVHAADGSWFHEPLRLQVVVEAPTKKIDQVIHAQAGVRNLVENGWVRLFALDPESTQSSRRSPSGVWEAC